MITKCPGQDTRFWKPNDVYNVECPKCSKPVEFFKDDIRRRCKECGHMFINPKLNLGCARWCQYADQCVGAIGKEEFKEIITLAMKEHCIGDKEKIDNALKVLRFVENILEHEEGNPKVVIAAGLLYDIGLQEIEKKPERAKKSDQAKDILPTVRDILERSGSKPDIIEEVCHIIENHHHHENSNTLNSKIVYDAVQLFNLRDKYDSKDKEKLKKIINKIFFTTAGKKMAEEGYFGERLEE
jgi:hypothetical protein